MKKLLFLPLILLFSTACIKEIVVPEHRLLVKKVTTVKGLLSTTDTVKKVMDIIIWGQSNVGIYAESDFNNLVVHNINAFNFNVNPPQIDSTFSAIQTRYNLVGFMLPALDSLTKTLHSNWTINVIQFHQGNTSLHSQWNPTVKNNDGSLFRKLIVLTDELLMWTKEPADKVYVVGYQGESDCTGTYYSGYYALQTKMVDTLKTRYKVNKYIDFQITSANYKNTYGNTVRAAKVQVANEHLGYVQLVKLPFKKSIGLLNSDSTHLNITKGVPAAADSVIKIILTDNGY